MKSVKSALLLILCLAVVACCAVSPPREAIEDTDERTVESLLAYSTGLRRLTGAELARETQVARQVFTKDTSNVVRLRLVLLLSAPNNNVRDSERASALLEPLSKDGSIATPVRNFALLLGALIDEQKRTHVLQQKLSTLQSIEKDTTDRDKAPYPPAGQ
jgi:hypothetical protein